MSKYDKDNKGGLTFKVSLGLPAGCFVARAVQHALMLVAVATNGITHIAAVTQSFDFIKFSKFNLKFNFIQSLYHAYMPCECHANARHS